MFNVPSYPLLCNFTFDKDVLGIEKCSTYPGIQLIKVVKLVGSTVVICGQDGFMVFWKRYAFVPIHSFMLCDHDLYIFSIIICLE